MFKKRKEEKIDLSKVPWWGWVITIAILLYIFSPKTFYSIIIIGIIILIIAVIFYFYFKGKGAK